MDKFTRAGMLLEFYGGLLSKRQKEVTALYYEENFSLSEIAEEFGITRQGVYDALKSGEKALEGYETKLGLAARFTERDEDIHRIDELLEKIAGDAEAGKLKSEELSGRLAEVRKIVDDMKE